MAANPNTMTFKQVFNGEYQMSHFKEPVYQVLADTRLESSLTKGQQVHRSYTSDVGRPNDMGADGSYETRAISDTQETLTINFEKENSFYIKKLDELQAHLPVAKKYGSKLMNSLINNIDGDVLLTAYQGAGTTLDDGNFSGTTGNGHEANASNIATVFATAKQKLIKQNTWYNKRFQGGTQMKIEVPEGMPIAVITPELLTYIELYLGGKNSDLGDAVSRNGYQGYFNGFNLFISNALPWTGTLAMATNPTDGDTVVYNGVTVTFVDTLSGGASEIHITGSVDVTRAKFVEWANAAGANAEAEATNTGYSAASAADQKLLKGATWTNDNTANTATVVASGWGVVEVSETFTDATDTWTVGKEVVHCLFALSKSVSLVVQKTPEITTRPSPSARIGKDVIAWTVYGIKVFNDQAPMIVSYSVLSTSFTAGATVVN